jgi:hypothetical protein
MTALISVNFTRIGVYPDFEISGMTRLCEKYYHFFTQRKIFGRHG